MITKIVLFVYLDPVIVRNELETHVSLAHHVSTIVHNSIQIKIFISSQGEKAKIVLYLDKVS